MTHSTEVAIRSAEEPARATEKACSRCNKALPRHYVRALNATYHLDCFTCLVVANKFFPITSPNGETFALCEKDYYRQLDLLCYRCDQPLQHSYISADDKKYHLDHFTCSMCPTVFGPEDVYYEEDGNVFCGKHYAQIASIKCVGCQLGILRQYIEITTDTVAEPWHPECYMIYKFWHVRIAPQVYTPTSRHESIGSVTNLDKDQIVDRAPPSLSNITEDIIYSIWTILSTFEESSAACISDMLIHVSKGVYVEALHVAEKFIMHVHTIFTAIDDLEDQLAQFDDATGLQHTKEPKILCKRIIRFFALLSNSEDITSSKGIEMTEELLSLVTGLAHYLKMLIRAALMGALKAEREYGSKISLNGLLHKLAEINDRDTAVAFQLSYRDIGVSSDLCALCQVTLEEECISYKSRRWHKACFNCDGCGRTLKHLYQKAAYDEAGHRVLCSTCTPQVPVPPTVRPFAFVTQLEQYSFLLRVALKRLYNLLNRKNGRLSATLLSPKAPPKTIESPAAGMTRVHPGDTAAHAPPPAKAPRGEDQKTIDMDVEHVMPPSPTVIRPPSTADVMAAAAPPEDMGITERPKDPPAPATAQSDLKRKPTLERHYVQADAVALVMVDQDAVGPPVPPKEGLLPRASSAVRLPEEALRETQFYRPTIVDPPLSWEKPRDHRSRTMQPRSRTEGSLPLGSAANSTGSTPGGTQPPTPEAV
ncbi:Rho-type GTPase activating protein Rga1, partial [Tieghemiomyces parasiticus]